MTILRKIIEKQYSIELQFLKDNIKRRTNIAATFHAHHIISTSCITSEE